MRWVISLFLFLFVVGLFALSVCEGKLFAHYAGQGLLLESREPDVQAL